LAQTIEKLQEEDIVWEIARLFPRQGKWTEKDYFSLPETNRIIELSGGRLIISPSPTLRHQRVLKKLSFLMDGYIENNNLGEIIVAPMGVRLWEGTIREPDIIFMSNEHSDRLNNECLGIPDLVVEILSESNKKQDLDEKFKEYEIAGIPEYWVVDPFQQILEVFTLEKGAYILFGKFGNSEIAYSKLLAGFQVAVDSVFE